MPKSEISPNLNPSLKLAHYSDTFGETGRVHIPDILTEESAQRLFEALESEIPWGLIFNEGEKTSEFSSVSQDDYQAMAVAAWERARFDFQYFYQYYPILQGRTVFPDPDQFLAKLVSFLNSPSFLAFLSEVTGFRSIECLTSTATLFKPLDFLTVHDDAKTGGRLFAYVLNMTPEWRPDWGGALQFFDGDDLIEEGYLPTFNALNLFRIPKRHSVSQIASFGGSRYSISGWFGSTDHD
jgi:SM-20-related protein